MIARERGITAISADARWNQDLKLEHPDPVTRRDVSPTRPRP
jgi:hypothetical protein